MIYVCDIYYTNTTHYRIIIINNVSKYIFSMTTPHTHTHEHTYMHTYIHTYTHVHTHIHTQSISTNVAYLELVNGALQLLPALVAAGLVYVQ